MHSSTTRFNWRTPILAALFAVGLLAATGPPLLAAEPALSDANFTATPVTLDGHTTFATIGADQVVLTRIDVWVINGEPAVVYQVSRVPIDFGGVTSYRTAATYSPAWHDSGGVLDAPPLVAEKSTIFNVERPAFARRT